MKIVNGKKVRESRADLAQQLVDKAEYQANLPELRREMIAVLNSIAEAQRNRWITPGSGKALAYDAKRREATAILAGNPGPHPYAEARAARTGVSINAVALEWTAQVSAWQIVGAAIEDAADAAAAAINALALTDTFEAEAEAIIAAIVWPVPPAQ